MLQLMFAALMYMRRKPLHFLVLLVAAIYYLSPRNGKEPSQIVESNTPSLPNPRPLDLFGAAARISNITHKRVAVLNPLPKLSLSNDGVPFVDWKDNQQIIYLIKNNQVKLAKEIQEFLNNKLDGFIKDNVAFHRHFEEKKQEINLLFLGFMDWSNILASAIAGLEESGGTCGEMAAVNRILAKCLVADIKAECITVSNTPMNHVFLVLNRSGTLEEPSEWNNAVIVDTWSGGVFSKESLPVVLQSKWHKWTILRFDLQAELDAISWPAVLKDKFVTFVNSVLAELFKKIAKEFPEAFKALNDELQNDLSCIKPFRI